MLARPLNWLRLAPSRLCVIPPPSLQAASLCDDYKSYHVLRVSKNAEGEFRASHAFSNSKRTDNRSHYLLIASDVYDGSGQRTLADHVIIGSVSLSQQSPEAPPNSPPLFLLAQVALISHLRNIAERPLLASMNRLLEIMAHV